MGQLDEGSLQYGGLLAENPESYAFARSVFSRSRMEKGGHKQGEKKLPRSGTTAREFFVPTGEVALPDVLGSDGKTETAATIVPAILGEH